MKKVSSTILNLRSPLPLSLFAFQAPELDAPVQHPQPGIDHIDDDDLIDDDDHIDDHHIDDDDIKRPVMMLRLISAERLFDSSIQK